ncbi:MAG: hypothetical protein A3H44_09730 [Gammaproteobacteria bacterium RIFCSPLOWO2_02_FULL_57_10]|nr:MAG: hypothetical protein A3H44_09730 [Gammaproteobacteria bacterium RIFCSPLOWO2_02_FULL_57_10]
MFTRKLSYILVIAAVAFSTSTLAQNESRLPEGIPDLEAGQINPPSANWLLDAEDDQERFRRIQIYAGGTYEQMWQIGYRYEQIYHAIIDENWELADHHWDKITSVFNVALMKRPRRTPNAEAMFLNSSWIQFKQALDSHDVNSIRQSFQNQRNTCMACHVAEEMPFLNDSPIFRNTAEFPEN